MPAEAPKIGETWEFSDPAQGPAQAVILDILSIGEEATGVVLVNRQGRRISFPLRSFNTVWRLVHDSLEQSCLVKGCSHPGVLRPRLREGDDPSPGGPQWVCGFHAEPFTDFLLPIDQPDDLSLPGGLAQCPCCGASTQEGTSEAQQIDGTTFVLRRCGRCSRRWSLLLGRGLPDDGILFAETIQRVAHHFENQGMAASAFVGLTALNRVRQAAGGLGNPDSPTLAGILLRTSEIGDNNVIVIGEVPKTGGGVQRLGLGSARLIGERIYPLPKTFWRSLDGQRCVYVVGCTPEQDRVRIEDLNTTSMISSAEFFSTHVEEQGFVHRDGGVSTPQLGTTWAFRNDLNLMVKVMSIQGGPKPEVGYESLMAQGIVRYASVETFFARYWPHLPQQSPSTPAVDTNDTQGPEVGALWWHQQLMTPVLIRELQSLGPNESTSVVVFSLAADDDAPATAMLRSNFLATYGPDAPEPPCAVGDELIDDQDRVFRAVTVDKRLGLVQLMAERGTKPAHATTSLVTWGSIARSFTKLHRRSRDEILMCDDD